MPNQSKGQHSWTRLTSYQNRRYSHWSGIPRCKKSGCCDFVGNILHPQIFQRYIPFRTIYCALRILVGLDKHYRSRDEREEKSWQTGLWHRRKRYCSWGCTQPPTVYTSGKASDDTTHVGGRITSYEGSMRTSSGCYNTWLGLHASLENCNQHYGCVREANSQVSNYQQE